MDQNFTASTPEPVKNLIKPGEATVTKLLSDDESSLSND